jgi:hypothetical protein
MPSEFDFEIPEFNRIGSMMRDLMDGPPAAQPTQPRRTPAARTGKAARRKRPRAKRVGSFTLGQFAEGANWRNATSFTSALRDATAGRGTRLGGLTVTAFAEGVNWRNAANGPVLQIASQAGEPPPTVEGFWGEVQWE